MADSFGNVGAPFNELQATLSRLTVPELQQELKRRGLRRSGLKAKLVDRLREAIEIEEVERASIENSEPADESLEISATKAGEEEQHIQTAQADQIEIKDTFQEEYVQQIHKDEQNLAEGTFERPMDELGHDKSQKIEDSESTIIFPNQIPESTQSTDKQELEQEYEQTAEIANNDGHINNEESEASEGIKDDIVPTPLGVPDEEQKEDKEMDIDVKIVHETRIEEDLPNLEQPQNSNEAQDKVENDVEVQQSATEQNTVALTHHDEEKEEKDDGIDIEVSHDDKVDIEDAGDGDENVGHDHGEKEDSVPKKKQSAPVQIKKRKSVLSEDGVAAGTQDSATPRKRRWGSSARKDNKESVTISTDSLKGLNLDISVIPPGCYDPLGLGLDYGEMEEGEIDESVDGENTEVKDVEMKDENTIEIDKENEPIKKEARRGRIVRISTKDTVVLQRVKSNDDMEEVAQTHVASDATSEVVTDQKVSLLPEIQINVPEEVQERSPSPAKNPPSKTLSVLNLVRPFTLRQLKEFLGKTGTVIEEGFWINKIKSHCYVTYETLEEAEFSRNAIHGAKWPSGNPKILSVDFAVNDKMFRDTEGKLGTDQSSSPSKSEDVQAKKEEADKSRDKDRLRERRSRDKQSKENDIQKRREHEKEKKAEDGSKHREKKEAPAKLLDDLFRKTKSTPCIYWLPLTKEQIAEKDKEREIRREQRRNERNVEIAKEDKEREDRRKQRETEMQQHQREHPRERRSPPPPNRNRNISKSPLMKRPSDTVRRDARNIPIHRRRSASSSSS